MAMPAWTCVITIFCVFENIQIAFQYSWPVQNSWPGAQGTWVSNQDTNNNGYNDNNNNNNGYNSNNNNGYNNNNNNNNNGNNKNGYNNNNNNNNNNKNNNNNYAGVAGSPPVVIPASTKQTASLIFFHGLSNQADRFTGIFQSQIRVPYMKFIFPNAASRPVSLMAGMRTPAWFDLMGYSSNSPEDGPGIEKAKNYAHALIRAEIAAGIPPERIIVGGYSQGAALAIYAGITFNQTLGGIISLSGWLLESSQIPGNNQANRKTPIFVGHGRQDQYVQFNFAQMTVQALNSFDPNVQFNQYSSMGHDSTPEEHHDVFQFIENHVPPTAS